MKFLPIHKTQYKAALYLAMAASAYTPVALAAFNDTAMTVTDTITSAENKTGDGIYTTTGSGVIFGGTTAQTVDGIIVDAGDYLTRQGGGTTTIGTIDATATGAYVYAYNATLIVTSSLTLGDNYVRFNSASIYTGILSLSSGASLSTTNMTITASADSSATFSTNINTGDTAATYKGIEDGVLNNLAITNATITAQDLALTSIALSNSSISANSITLNSLSSSAGLDIDSDTLTYTVTALDGATVSTTDLTLNISLTDEEYTALTSVASVDFSITGLESATGDIALNFTSDSGDSYNLIVDASTGTSESGSFNFNTGSTIPEPSSATLSLLALTGLMARRRRKV